MWFFGNKSLHNPCTVFSQPDSAGCMQVLRKGTSFSQRGNQIPRPVFFIVGEGVTAGTGLWTAPLSLPILRVWPAQPLLGFFFRSLVHFMTSSRPLRTSCPSIWMGLYIFPPSLSLLLLSSYLRRPQMSPAGTELRNAARGCCLWEPTVWWHSLASRQLQHIEPSQLHWLALDNPAFWVSATLLPSLFCPSVP